MAEPKTYTAEDFKGCNGRRVLVEGVIDDERPEEFARVAVRFGPDRINEADVPYSAIVEILPEEIGVGDVVNTLHHAKGVVRCLDGGEAWVKFEGGCATLRLDTLTLVERGQ